MGVVRRDITGTVGMRVFPWTRRLVVLLAAGSTFVAAGQAYANSNCGLSGSHTLCVNVVGGSLAGPMPVGVTNSPNSGTVTATWTPAGKPSIQLIMQFAPSPTTGDYSFVWPTQKYLDGPGTLSVRAGSTGSASSVAISVTLANGNQTDFVHSPNDWSSFLPPPTWTSLWDPVVGAVGDGPSGEAASNGLAEAIFGNQPDLFLFLGDIYETGTFTEELNHYGENSMDGGAGTLWGKLASITQPTLGNHEAPNLVAWTDYFHGRPAYTSFRYGNVLFLDLASSGPSMAAGKAQYNYVKSLLTSAASPPPPCIVSFWHAPGRSKGTIHTSRLAMWKLLADNGGDVVLNGHMHSMVQYQPLSDQLTAPSAGQPTMIELVNGAGGHSIAGTPTGDPLVEWAKGKTVGTIALTLVGARAGGTPTRLSWVFEDKAGNPLHSGSRDCS
jgi:calcineurin-like phosphoesterase family protein